MSIVKLNNRSVKDVTAFGSISSLGSLTHIATQTASSSSSISFTSGIDSTYKEYIFYFVNMHPSASSQGGFQFNGSDDSSSHSYDIVKTTTLYRAYHFENDGGSGVGYRTSSDNAQSSGYQRLTDDDDVGTDSDSSASGFLHLFNPSSTTFVKHFISRFNNNQSDSFTIDTYMAGYFNNTNPITALNFKFGSGNIDSGQILLFGLN